MWRRKQPVQILPCPCPSRYSVHSESRFMGKAQNKQHNLTHYYLTSSSMSNGKFTTFCAHRTWLYRGFAQQELRRNTQTNKDHPNLVIIKSQARQCLALSRWDLLAMKTPAALYASIRAGLSYCCCWWWWRWWCCCRSAAASAAAWFVRIRFKCSSRRVNAKHHSAAPESD